MNYQNFLQAVHRADVLSVSEYDEDTWTSCLFYGLQNGIEEFEGDLYVHLRGRRTFVGGGRLLPGVTNDGLLFKGSPDFMFKLILINVSHSVEDDDGDGDRSSDTSRSGESVRVEHPHQLLPPIELTVLFQKPVSRIA